MFWNCPVINSHWQQGWKGQEQNGGRGPEYFPVYSILFVYTLTIFLHLLTCKTQDRYNLRIVKFNNLLQPEKLSFDFKKDNFVRFDCLPCFPSWLQNLSPPSPSISLASLWPVSMLSRMWRPFGTAWPRINWKILVSAIYCEWCDVYLFPEYKFAFCV